MNSSWAVSYINEEGTNLGRRCMLLGFDVGVCLESMMYLHSGLGLEIPKDVGSKNKKMAGPQKPVSNLGLQTGK